MLFGDGLALGAKLKASFRTVERTIEGGLVVEAPAGRGWVWSDIGKATVLARFEVDGPLRRAFEFGSLAGKSKAVTNAAAQQLVAQARERLADIGREPKFRKKKLNRAFGTASWFEVKGKSKEGEPVNIEAWIFRGKSRIYVLLTLTMGRRSRYDPLLRAILDGLHE